MIAARPDRAARMPRAFALAFSTGMALGAFALALRIDPDGGLFWLDLVRGLLILVSTWWLAWGAATAMAGLLARPAPRPETGGPVRGRTVVLMPVHNEDPVAAFARLAAIDASLDATELRGRVGFAVLSDTGDAEVAARERLWFRRLVAERQGEGRFFYRRRDSNAGRKAGNIEAFIRSSGAAWDHAVILDADSLMDGETIVALVRRMEAAPRVGLIQTLPRVVAARSRFGRAMQFAAGFHSPVYARGLAEMQGTTGPFWGHNAIVRIRAFAESCGLPELSGPPPFGGPILSHDYVEAALLARAGWEVRLDPDLGGSFEEGPGNIVDHARRDRRWCQGNLQHARLVAAPGLRGWSRFVFVQGIFAYVAPVFWLAFLFVSVAAVTLAPPPDLFPFEGWPFPVFPDPDSPAAVALAAGIVALLVLPKLAIAAEAALTGRAGGHGGRGAALRSVLAELLLSSVTAPILLAYQTRSVLQVLRGRDGGWPPNNRGDGRLTLAEGWAAAWWIVLAGVAGLAATDWLAPGLVPWLLPVALPMIAAPAIIAWTSRPGPGGLFAVPEDGDAAPVLARWRMIRARWEGAAAAEPAPAAAPLMQPA
jgi:membrane glycosyltransferase